MFITSAGACHTFLQLQYLISKIIVLFFNYHAAQDSQMECLNAWSKMAQHESHMSALTPEEEGVLIHGHG